MSDENEKDASGSAAEDQQGAVSAEYLAIRAEAIRQLAAGMDLPVDLINPPPPTPQQIWDWAFVTFTLKRLTAAQIAEQRRLFEKHFGATVTDPPFERKATGGPMQGHRIVGGWVDEAQGPGMGPGGPFGPGGPPSMGGAAASITVNPTHRADISINEKAVGDLVSHSEVFDAIRQGVPLRLRRGRRYGG